MLLVRVVREHFSKIKSSEKMRCPHRGNLITSEEAVTAIEYALLGALIAVVIVSAVTLVGSKTLDLWGLVSRCVEAAASGVGSCP
ncbi:Flp family type IVb pilin [Polaromonas sp.]|uniref:Flp family type IVb pilin n=1 Tax=Polaromonas sp. TaxID=1869339 RepID=UPI003525ED21